MKKLLIPIALLIAFTSCKKKKEEPQPVATTTTTQESSATNTTPTTPEQITIKNFLTSHPWKIKQYLAADGTDFTRDCDKDDIATFDASGNFTINLGSVKCSASQSATEANKWGFVGNNQIVLIDSDGEADTTSVSTINDTNLNLAILMKVNGVPVTSGTIFMIKP